MLWFKINVHLFKKRKKKGLDVISIDCRMKYELQH